MALATRDEMLSLDLTYNGEPFVLTAAKAGLGSDLDLTYNAEPFALVTYTDGGGTQYNNSYSYSGVVGLSIPKTIGKYL